MEAVGLCRIVSWAMFRWVMYTLIGFVILVADPFGLGSLSEAGSQKVLYEVVGPLYTTESRDDITIVLVNEASLQWLYENGLTSTNEWPLLYTDWGLLLKTIGQYAPRAIFVDVFFERERVMDSTFGSMQRALEGLQKQIPVYFAGGMRPYTSSFLAKIDQSANLAGSAWEGYGSGVPLQQGGQPMAALALYREACSSDRSPLPGCVGLSDWTNKDGATTTAMSVVWGSYPALPFAAELEGYVVENYCSNNSASIGDLWMNFLKSAAGELWKLLPDNHEDSGVRCLFHRVVDADELMRVFDHGTMQQKEALTSALQDKVVLLGTNFEGLPDVIETPGLGLVPGVEMHAMMLDNLMKYGPDYVRIAGLNTVPYNVAVWSVIVLVLVCWMGYREWHHAGYNGSQSNRSLVPFTGWGATVFFVVSFVLVFFAAVFTYYAFRFEPSNAIGFLGLAEVTRRIYGKKFL